MNSNPQRALFTIVTVSYNCCSLIEKQLKVYYSKTTMIQNISSSMENLLTEQ